MIYSFHQHTHLFDVIKFYQRCGSCIRSIKYITFPTSAQSLYLLTKFDERHELHIFENIYFLLKFSKGKHIYFQGTFRVYPIPKEGSDPPRLLEDYPSPIPQEIIARVYVVSAKDLAPRDAGSSSDPYVRIKFGKDSVSSKDNYKPDTLNPIFGR